MFTCLAVSGCSSTVEGEVANDAHQHLSAPGTDWDDLDLDVESLRREYLATYAEIAGIDDPPEVEVVREVSTSEAPQTKADCMVAAGYPVRVSQEGIILDGEVPDDQIHAYNLQMYVCSAQYPTDPRVGSVLPRVRAEMQYEYLTATVVPCLEGLGFSPEAAPSQQVWLDGYYGASTELWDPYEAAAGSIAELERAYDSCPSLAPGLFP